MQAMHNRIKIKAHWIRTLRFCGALSLAPVLAFAESHGMQQGHMQGHAQGHSKGHSHNHDQMTMPGLRGENASPRESADIAMLFRNFMQIDRSVENLSNGIKTITIAHDPQVMDILVRHAVEMIARVEELNDPKIIIQSPTLDLFFLRGEEISTEIDVTEAGLVITQTAKTPEMIAALHSHAAEVTAMTERGMAAVHEMMMRQGRGH